MFRLRFLVPLAVMLALASLFLGVGKVSVAGLMSGSDNDWLLLTESRIPRLIAIVIAGACLSVCGLVMQCLSRNRFVSPTTAGLEDSARLGVLLAIIFFSSSSNLVQVAIAAVTTFAGSLLFAAILRNIKHRDAVFIPLVGMMLGNIINAFTIFFALQFDLLQNIQSWLQGDFSGVLHGRYETLYISIPALALIYIYARGHGGVVCCKFGIELQRHCFIGSGVCFFIYCKRGCYSRSNSILRLDCAKHCGLIYWGQSQGDAAAYRRHGGFGSVGVRHDCTPCHLSV